MTVELYSITFGTMVIRYSWQQGWQDHPAYK